MLDYIFISPLGWSAHVWDKIINSMHLNQNDYEVVEFLNDSYEDITIENIFKDLNTKFRRLSLYGTIVTSSYGSIVTLAYLKKYNIKINKIILIDGFEMIPNKNTLIEIISNKSISYPSLNEYHNTLLTSEKEKNDRELLEIINHNLTYINSNYVPKLSNKNMIDYLSLFSDINPIVIFQEVQENIKEFFIFSNLELPISYIKISDQDHLLMLTKSDRVLKYL
ncbi:hypothetical protein [Streptococcus pluranimalium]|uniref:hypothetical protein n=1 Tax=Streptococcus pluranimalium TaxID=82348 RepID=UPI003F67DF36